MVGLGYSRFSYTAKYFTSHIFQPISWKVMAKKPERGGSLQRLKNEMNPESHKLKQFAFYQIQFFFNLP